MLIADKNSCLNLLESTTNESELDLPLKNHHCIHPNTLTYTSDTADEINSYFLGASKSKTNREKSVSIGMELPSMLELKYFLDDTLRCSFDIPSMTMKLTRNGDIIFYVVYEDNMHRAQKSVHVINCEKLVSLKHEDEEVLIKVSPRALYDTLLTFTSIDVEGSVAVGISSKKYSPLTISNDKIKVIVDSLLHNYLE